jgi:hypothetical protein
VLPILLHVDSYLKVTGTNTNCSINRYEIVLFSMTVFQRKCKCRAEGCKGVLCLQGVRLILSVCLLVSSVAAFCALLEYAKRNVALAGILLLFIIMKGPTQARTLHH